MCWIFLLLNNVAIYALRVSHFRYAMTNDLKMTCHRGRSLSYSELLNLALGVKTDQEAIREFSIS